MTDAELIRRLTNAYRIAYVDAVHEYRRLWDLIDDVSTGKKQPPAFYDTPEKVARWKQGFIREQFRQENVIHQIARKLASVGVDMRSEIKSYIHDVYRYNREMAIGTIKSAANVNFDQYDKRQIDILLDDEQPVFSKIAYRNLGHDSKIVERLQREFAAGIANGDDKTKMLKRVQKVTGQSRYQAWRVAQTERTRVASQARDRVINEAADKGVKVLKEWSTRMRNSREAHISLDGQTIPSGSVFHVEAQDDVISRSKKGVKTGSGYDIAYPGDPNAPARAVCNCYCVLIPKVLKKNQPYPERTQPPTPSISPTAQAAQQPLNVASQATSQPTVQHTILGKTNKLQKTMSQTEYDDFVKLVDNSATVSLYEKYADSCVSIIKVANGGVYKPASDIVEYDFSTAPGQSKYSVIAHEMAHMFDAHVGRSATLTFKEVDTINKYCVIGSGITSTLKVTPSSSDEFLSAMRKDKAGLKSILSDNAELSKMRTGNFHNASAGVQDAMDGFFGTQGKGILGWGHGDKYYNRFYNRKIKTFGLEKQLKDAYNDLGFGVNSQTEVKQHSRDYETASELWANVVSAITCGGEELDAFKRYMPNTVASAEKIIGGL